MRSLLLASALLLGCGTATEVRPLAVVPVEWNAQKVPVGGVAAVAESGDVVTVFSDLGAITFVGGAWIATDASVRDWRGAATIPAADGAGSWMVGLDNHGHLHRVRARSKLEAVSARFGLENSDVRALVGLGRGRVAFSLVDALAIAEADRVTRYDYPFAAIAGGDGRGGGLTTEGARIFDPFRGVDRTFAIEGLRSIAIASTGRVVVASDRAIWIEDESGRLAVRYKSDIGALHGLAASSETMWFADGDELGVVASSVSRTSGLPISPRTIVGSESGDVWVIDSKRALHRFSTARTAGLWQTTIAPIQSRVCSDCHGPAGSAGIDLSGAARWEANRSAIERRVVNEKTMPPPGHSLTPDDRAAIARWVSSSQNKK